MKVPAPGARSGRRLLARSITTLVALSVPLGLAVAQSATVPQAASPSGQKPAQAAPANVASNQIKPPFVVRPINSSKVSSSRAIRSGGGGAVFNAACGTLVRSAHPGYARIYKNSKWGGPHTVVVKSTSGGIMSYYGHMATHRIVDGQVIQSGQILGTVGKLGKASRCSMRMLLRSNGGKTTHNPKTWLNYNQGKVLRSGGLYGDRGFKIATLNILGASHTAKGGTKASWPGYRKRLPKAIATLEAAGSQVVGFQEMQPRQRKMFLDRVGSRWSIYPSTTNADPENSIAWRKDKFDLVEGKTFPVPYFDGHIRQMPYVLLRDRSTGRTTYVINVHNPANTKRFPNQGRWRKEAIKRERNLMIQLRASGRPVFLTGDFNAIKDAFCPLTAGKLSISPDSIPSMRCSMPRYYWVDWIFAAGQTRFTDMRVDTSLRDKRITDHPLVITRAHLQD